VASATPAAVGTVPTVPAPARSAWAAPAIAGAVVAAVEVVLVTSLLLRGNDE
jgi:hypothetical protein